MQDIVFMITLSVCLFTDLKYRKIFNKILLPAIIIGLIFNIVNAGILGVLITLEGFFLGLFFLLFPYLAGGIGAGDVKLLATIGAIKGADFVFITFLGMGLAGGVLAIAILLYQRRFFSTIKDLIFGLIILFSTKFKVVSFGNKNENNMFPYGVAITIGACVAYLMGVT
jgi:prepilin peptidase CpaA